MNKLTTLLLGLLLTINAFSQNDLKPTSELALLNIKVMKNDKSASSGGDIIKLIGKRTGKTFEVRTNGEGKASVLIPKNEHYTIKYKGLAQDEEYAEFDIPDTEALVNFDFDIVYELPKLYILEHVYFDVNKATLKPASFPELNKLAGVMLRKKKMIIEIEGHTDSDGSDESNLILSTNRAKSVLNYLIKRGVASSRLSSVGYGERKPIVANDTAANKQKNRRTVVNILEQ